MLKDTPEQTEVRIGTVVEQLRYDIVEFTVKAGKKIVLTFANSDFMPHNIVFVQPGAADEVGLAAIQLGAKGFDLNWVPESNKIIIASLMINYQDETVLEFNAPEKPGDYPFVCTFLGHHLRMRGVMKVRE